jgi:hypothetical protein
MDKGRRTLYRLEQAMEERSTSGVAAPAPVLCSIATRVARAEFKGVLSDFVFLSFYKALWVERLRSFGTLHPFLRVVDGAERVSLHL